MEPLSLDTKHPTSYCIPLWLRDEQVAHALTVVPKSARIQPHDKRPDPIAVVGYGPSLNDTVDQVRDFRYIISCSGSHRFLVDRGIIPTWHVDVDPRPHKVTLMGPPHPDVEYLIASACHPKLFEHLAGFHVTLWHVFANEADALRTLPREEWAITGGCNAGLRALTIARFLGFTDLHIFGMDGCDGPSGKHAAAHPNQAKDSAPVVCRGRTFYTTPNFLECAKGTFHELNQMPDVTAIFYGDGLVQEMAKNYVPDYPKGMALIGVQKAPVISDTARQLNAQLHAENLAYGVSGDKHADTVKRLVDKCKLTSVLDYGCGKGYLAKALPFPIWEYDPAIPEKSVEPRPADLVVCTDVLEHIEPDYLDAVLGDLARCVRQVGYFVIHTGAAKKLYADGRNAHLIQQGQGWWEAQLTKHFQVAKVTPVGVLLHVIVAPLAARPPSMLSCRPYQDVRLVAVGA